MKDSDKNNDGRIDFDGERWPWLQRAVRAARRGLTAPLSCRVPEDDGGRAVRDQTFLGPAAAPSPAPPPGEQPRRSAWPRPPTQREPCPHRGPALALWPAAELFLDAVRCGLWLSLIKRGKAELPVQDHAGFAQGGCCGAVPRAGGRRDPHRGVHRATPCRAVPHTTPCSAPHHAVPCHTVPPGSPQGPHAAGRRGAAVPTGCWAGASAELRVSMRSSRFPQQRDGERGPIPTGWGSRPAAPVGLLLPTSLGAWRMQRGQHHPGALWACREGGVGAGDKVGESSSPPSRG